MRAALISSYVAAMAIVAVSHVLLPETVAIHFGADGEPDGWGPRSVNSAAFAVMYTLSFLLFLLVPSLSVHLPADLVNIPNRHYWLADANRPRFRAIMERLMFEFGTVMMCFLAAVGVLTLDANLADPVQLDEGTFLTALVAFLGYTAWWCVRLFRAFRLPPDAPSARPTRPR